MESWELTPAEIREATAYLDPEIDLGMIPTEDVIPARFRAVATAAGKKARAELLEALKKDGIPLAAEDHHPWELGIDQKGTLVFIPEGNNV
jgi:hypothetical protein